MSEKNFFAGKIQDLIRRQERGEDLIFSNFLTSEEASDAMTICRKSRVPYAFYGGYEDAERKMLAISSMDEETLRFCYPIVAISISGYDLELISNRDILGALMGSGIRRDLLGDIIARDGVYLFFAAEQIADYMIENIVSIGRQSVELRRMDGDFFVPPPHFDEFRDTVASLRLDAIVASLARISREQACEWIELGLVSVNHKPIDKKTKIIEAGATISIRGRGKWIMDECDSFSKKGRIIIKTRKYI